MILINLLPHRLEEKKRKKDSFIRSMIGVVVLSGLLGYGFYNYFEGLAQAQNDRNAKLEKEVTFLKGQIKEIAGIKGEITGLQARQKAVENLQVARNLEVNLMNQLAKLVPEGVYLTRLKQEGNVVLLEGFAQSNERVSEILEILPKGSAGRVLKADLIETKISSIVLSNKDTRSVTQFAMRIYLNDQEGQVPSSRKDIK